MALPIKTTTQDEADVGVIVGRFQVPILHEGHLGLIQSVRDKHKKVIIFLGLAPAKCSKNNPLDFEARKQMLLEAFPKINVLYTKDCKEDAVWSRKLDEQIGDILSPAQTAVIYGSRDSFIPHYTGKYPVRELVPTSYVSGSEIRKDICREVIATPEFRAGVVWAMGNQYPKCFPTVDIAIFDEDGEKLLLGRKPDEKQYRFIGGFADPKSPCYEADARREVKEETGIEITDPEYIGSTIIDDWRYRAEPDKIKTIFFAAKYQFGRIQADDDIAEVKWFNIKELTADDIVNTHCPLLAMLFEWYKKNNFKVKPLID